MLRDDSSGSITCLATETQISERSGNPERLRLSFKPFEDLPIVMLMLIATNCLTFAKLKTKTKLFLYGDNKMI